ncbi:S-crystallin 4 [Hydra vulgaris]|uniref:S-crystallin 4 n=1 Tax=Hydra vulgaris TaxID=6087 RepID=UPI00019272B0|nr:S-crystallin 4 [Hydra vulgaris]
MHPKYVLNYFGIQGRAEVARLMFHLKDVKFTDNQISFQDWPNLKHNHSKFPLEQMPTLEVDGQVICQSAAINFYLAETLDLYGATITERVVINQIYETLSDYTKEYFEIEYSKSLDESQKKEAFAEFSTKETTKLKFQFIESLLKRNNCGTGYFVGDSISLGDIVFHSTCEMIDETVLNKYPLLRDLNNRVKESPKLKPYLTSRNLLFHP